MRRPILPALLLAATVFVLPARADAGPTVELWLAADAGALGERVRAALSAQLATQGLGVGVASVTAAPAPSLRAALMDALALYRALRFADAATALRQLAQRAAELGGADLGTRDLGELYLYLALSAQEQGALDDAWEAFVRAVRIDPTRTLDPAQFPPRATAAHKRAQAELAPRATAELDLRVPADARVYLDGDEGHGPGLLDRRLLPGPHFVRVERPGYETYRGMLSVSGQGREIFAPVSRPIDAPTRSAGDDERPTARLQRAGDGWSLSLRARSVGAQVEASARIQLEDVDAVTKRLVERVFGPVPPRAIAKRPLWTRWWLWTTVGVAAAALAVGIPVGVTASRSSAPGTAGGALVPVR